VNDGGDTKRLEAGENRQAFQNLESTYDITAHAGAGLAITGPYAQAGSTISDFSSRDRSSTAADSRGADAFPPTASVPSRLSLSAEIRAARVPATWPRDRRDRFLPIDKLDKILTQERVRQELESNLEQSGAMPEDLDYLTKQVYNIASFPKDSKPDALKTTRKKLFAILVMMERVPIIRDFIDGGIFDCHLPFLPGPDEDLCRKLGDGTLAPVISPSTEQGSAWGPPQTDLFLEYQWQMLAPYFKMCCEKEPKVLDYILENKRVLPFFEDDDPNVNSILLGGMAEVYKVKIHPAHHNMCHPEAYVCCPSPSLVEALAE